jgi:hypothetical protein
MQNEITVEQLYITNPDANFKLANGRNRIFGYFWKTRGKTTYSATCLMGNRIKLNPTDIVIEVPKQTI